MNRASISISPFPNHHQLGNNHQETITVKECVSHLKLLAAIAKLRHDISTSDRLFGINDSEAREFSGEKRNLARARIREKRWAVYVSKAVDRFMAWWESCVPVSEGTAEISWTVDTLPPLGESYYLCLYWSKCLTIFYMYSWYGIRTCSTPDPFSQTACGYLKWDSGLQDYPGKL